MKIKEMTIQYNDKASFVIFKEKDKEPQFLDITNDKLKIEIKCPKFNVGADISDILKRKIGIKTIKVKGKKQ